MAEPTLREMYRRSGSSQQTSSVDEDSPQQPENGTPQTRASKPSATTQQTSGDSIDSDDAGFWYLSASQYPTPQTQSENAPPFFTSAQSASSSRPVGSTRQHSGETRRPTAPSSSDQRQQAPAVAQSPPSSRAPEDRQQYPSAPQPPSVSRPYDDRPRYTSASETTATVQTTGNSRRPSYDRTRYSTSVPETPQSAAGSFRRADRPSRVAQSSGPPPTTIDSSRPYDDRYRYSMRPTDDRQRYSSVSQATTIAPPASARVSEDKQRYSTGAPIAPNVSAYDFGRSAAQKTSTSNTGQPTIAPARPSVSINVPDTSSTAPGTDNKPNASEATMSKSTKEDLGKTPVTIEIFTALLGIPQGRTSLPLSNLRQAADDMDENHTPATAVSTKLPTPMTITSAKPPTRTSTGISSSIAQPFKVKSQSPHWLPYWLRRKPNDSEYDTSVYYNLIEEQKKTVRQYILYDTLVYICLFLQLVIAAILIILGAINKNYHIPIAVLGAVTGVITGILSLIRGQGLPQRLMQYADALRKVRDDVEFTERELRAGVRTVTYQECVDLRTAYENVREDANKNHPDSWTSWTSIAAGSGSSSSRATTTTKSGYTANKTVVSDPEKAA